jgi:hypothetical protein
MANVILQPCANRLAREHFQTTVAREIPLEDIRNILSTKEWHALRAFYGEDTCAVWGVEAKSGSNILQWQKIRPGDMVFFSADKKLFSAAKVTMSLHSKKLARRLWGKNEDGSTWEYIYFLRDVQVIEIPVRDLNSAAGYKLTKNVQGVTVLSP